MARPSALLIAAAVLLVAVCGQHTAFAAKTTNREWPVFIPVAGTVMEFMNYTRLQQFCNATVAPTVPGLLLCQIFAVRPSTTVANTVEIGAYYYTSDTIITEDAPVTAINNALALNANNGGIIRTAAAFKGVKRTATPTATENSPQSFTYLFMHFQLYYRGTLTGTTTNLGKAQIEAKLTAMDKTAVVTMDAANTDDAALVNGSNAYFAGFRVQGYWDNRFTMYNEIAAKLRDTSSPGAVEIILLEDSTQAITDTLTVAGYDAIAPEAGSDNLPPYRLRISFTTALSKTQLDANTAALLNAFRDALYQYLYPANEFVLAPESETPTTGSGALIQTTVYPRSAADALKILQRLNDEISSGNATRATFGGVLLSGVDRWGARILVADTTPVFLGASIRIPTTDFPLDQRYSIGIDAANTFLNSTFAPSSLCSQITQRTAGVAACFIDTVSKAKLGAFATGLTTRRKFDTLAVDGYVRIVLNATNILAALRLKRSLQVTLETTASVSGVAFADATNPALAREELWRPRDQLQTKFFDFNVPNETPAGTNYGVITSADSVGERNNLLTTAGSIFTTNKPYALNIKPTAPAVADVFFYIGRNDVKPASAPDTGIIYRVWVVAPKALSTTGLRLRMVFALAYDAVAATPIFKPTSATPSVQAQVKAVGTGYSVQSSILITYNPAAGALRYIDSTTPGDAATQANFEDTVSNQFANESSAVLDAAMIPAGTDPAVPVKLFALTEQAAASIFTQFGSVVNSTNGTFGSWTLRSTGFDKATAVPPISTQALPAAPAPPATATPPSTAPAAPATAPAAPVAPSAIVVGSIRGQVVGVDFYIITPPAVNIDAVCPAILADSARLGLGIVACKVTVFDTNAVLPTGAKFQQQAVTRVVTELTTDSATSASNLINAIITAINNKSFLRGFNIADANLVALAPVSVPTSTNQPATTAPTVAPATNGTFTTVDIYIVILGTALDSAGQAALNNECGSLLGGGATCTTKNIEQTTAARKMTTQASALRLTETVRAPASTYPSANAIVAKLQAAVRSNNGRLGGQQVVNVATIGSGSSAATRTAPALLALLATVLVAVLSAMAQF